jgi:hypothetical protein
MGLPNGETHNPFGNNVVSDNKIKNFRGVLKLKMMRIIKRRIQP